MVAAHSTLHLVRWLQPVPKVVVYVAVMSGAVPCLQVYDLAFARGTDIFGSVGADGSVRMFDLRSLEHSTIM